MNPERFEAASSGKAKVEQQFSHGASLSAEHHHSLKEKLLEKKAEKASHGKFSSEMQKKQALHESSKAAKSGAFRNEEEGESSVPELGMSLMRDD